MLNRMLCTECGKEVKRFCAACRDKRARLGILLHQRRFLRTWIAGTMNLNVRPFNGQLHLELFDARWHSYCGIAMMTRTERQRVRELPDDMCAECRSVFNQLVAEAAKEDKHATGFARRVADPSNRLFRA